MLTASVGKKGDLRGYKCSRSRQPFKNENSCFAMGSEWMGVTQGGDETNRGGDTVSVFWGNIDGGGWDGEGGAITKKKLGKKLQNTN